jgi:HK97 gp10 family phage protein
MPAQVQGLDQIRVKLHFFEEKMRRKVVGNALKKGSSLIRDQAIIELKKKQSKYSTGNLEMAIKDYVMTQKESGGRFIRGRKIGVQKGAYAFYWRFLEFGARPHTIKVNSKKILTDHRTFFGPRVSHPGTQKKPFMRPAYESKKDAAYRAIIDEMRRQLF